MPRRRDARAVVEEDRQFLKSSVGLAEPWHSRRPSASTESVPVVVADAREQDRDLPLPRQHVHARPAATHIQPQPPRHARDESRAGVRQLFHRLAQRQLAPVERAASHHEARSRCAGLDEQQVDAVEVAFLLRAGRAQPCVPGIQAAVEAGELLCSSRRMRGSLSASRKRARRLGLRNCASPCSCACSVAVSSQLIRAS